LQKTLLIFLLLTSILNANELVDALKGKKSQTAQHSNPVVSKKKCEQNIMDAIEKYDISFFRVSSEQLKEINNCLISNDLTPMMAAAYSDKVKIVNQFLVGGIDPNETNARGYTALHYAVFYGNYEIVSLLLDTGVSANARNNMGQTPIMIAAYYGNTKTIKLLLSKGADSTVVDNAGNSALELAAKKGKKDIVRLLKTNK
jgi:ankyrin repeat protein